ncbi:hypothetical protein [Nitrososphaera sp.]|uniref:hypothetical protein n=1 Tax=Nitrososphaera sp. TaxID=1971748 RepID=UPI00316F6559
MFKPPVDYTDFCKKVVEDDPSVILAGVISINKVLGLYIRPGGWAPDEKDIPRFITQVQMAVGIPQTNEKYFGPVGYVMINFRDLDNFNFPMGQQLMLVILAKDPYDHRALVRKIRNSIMTTSA